MTMDCISNLISCTHFGKACSRLGDSGFVFCKKVLDEERTKSRNHDLAKCVQEISFEIWPENPGTRKSKNPPVMSSEKSEEHWPLSPTRKIFLGML